MRAQAYLLRGRWLLALQAVKRGRALAGASHPVVHLMTVQFCAAAQVRGHLPGHSLAVPWLLHNMLPLHMLSPPTRSLLGPACLAGRAQLCSSWSAGSEDGARCAVHAKAPARSRGTQW